MSSSVIVYKFEGRLYRVVGKDGNNVVLMDIQSGERINVAGRVFMSDQFRVETRYV